MVDGEAHTIATPAGRIGALRWPGRDRAPAAVLLHSLGQDGGAWREVAAASGGRRPLWALDLPGHGRSSLPADAETATAAAALAPALAEVARRDGPPDLVAHAYAAPLLVSALPLLPDGFGLALILVAPLGVVPPTPGLLPAMSRPQAVAARALARSPERVRQAGATLCHDPGAVPDAAWRELARSLGLAEGLWRYGPALLTGVSPLLPALARLGRAARFVWCAADPVFPADQAERAVARAARDGPAHRQSRLEGTGHLPMLERPAALAALVLAGRPA